MPVVPSEVPSEQARVDAAVPLIDGLNPDQLDAVVHTRRSAAGRGRRRLGQDPGPHPPHRPPDRRARASTRSRILAITFTNKAADEMRQRVAGAGRAGGPQDVGEHVPLGLRAHPAPGRRRLGYPSSFSIYDQADAQRLTGYVIRDLGLDPKRFTAQGRPRHDQRSTRTTWSSPPSTRERAANIFERKIADIYREYQARLRQGRGHGLRRPADQHRAAVPRRTPTCWRTTSSGSSTSWSTSTRTPTGRRTS